MHTLVSGSKTLDLLRPVVMGILNVTPDSFSDGGRFYSDVLDVEDVWRAAESMLDDGAKILDIGGESTRPGAESVSESEELARVIPVVKRLRASTDAWISVDTSSPEVIRQAILAGADLINDVRSLTRPGALEAVADSDVAVCIMHMQGEPDAMQVAPSYKAVVEEVYEFLERRVEQLVEAGIDRSRILVDPGFGFGKKTEHNFALLAELQAFSKLDLPILVGMSRKSMIGHTTGRGIEGRLAGSLAVALLSAQASAHVIRVHDVSETSDVLKIWRAFEDAKKGMEPKE